MLHVLTLIRPIGKGLAPTESKQIAKQRIILNLGMIAVYKCPTIFCCKVLTMLKFAARRLKV